MASRSDLLFTSESWLHGDFFANCERSLYKVSNHLDIQNINRPDEFYSWISCNHVLEHVENDRKALQECYRILTWNGILQITVPTPGHCSHTTDWGFSDPEKFGHWRNYGADFLARLGEELPSAQICVQIFKDRLTSYHDVSFLVSKDGDVRKKICDAIFDSRGLCVVV